MSNRVFNPASPILSSVVTNPTVAQSAAINLSGMASPQIGFLVNSNSVGGNNLQATFQVMVSMDNVSFYDSGQVLPSVTGSARTFPVQYSGPFPYVLLQVTPSAGAGTVIVKAIAKGIS